MVKYYINLTTNYKLEDGTYGKVLTEPTECYTEACNQYGDIVNKINNRVVYSESEVKYDNGYYEPFFKVEMVSQYYNNGSFGGSAKSVKGGLEIYIGKFE